MLDFEQELEKFNPLLEVNHIENKIATEDMRDIIDLIKSELPDKGGRRIGKIEEQDREQ